MEALYMWQLGFAEPRLHVLSTGKCGHGINSSSYSLFDGVRIITHYIILQFSFAYFQ